MAKGEDTELKAYQIYSLAYPQIYFELNFLS